MMGPEERWAALRLLYRLRTNSGLLYNFMSLMSFSRYAMPGCSRFPTSISEVDNTLLWNNALTALCKAP